MGTDFFRLNDTDFGIGHVQFSCDEVVGKLTLEVSASLTNTERIGSNEQAEFSWVLYPPKLYLREVSFTQLLESKQLIVSEQLLDGCDIALYMLEHFDVAGLAEFTATHFSFAGQAQIDGTKVELSISCLLPG